MNLFFGRVTVRQFCFEIYWHLNTVLNIIRNDHYSNPTTHPLFLRNIGMISIKSRGRRRRKKIGKEKKNLSSDDLYYAPKEVVWKPLLILESKLGRAKLIASSGLLICLKIFTKLNLRNSLDFDYLSTLSMFSAIHLLFLQNLCWIGIWISAKKN